MKRLFLIIFVLAGFAANAQQTLPCTNIGVNNLGGQSPYITGSCLEVNSDLHVNNKIVIMEADNRIHFGPGTHISPVQQGDLHASIRPNALQVAWIEPGTVGSVGQFKKLELGIKLNNEIEELIDEFISAGKSDVAPRTSPSLNPFDPDEIDVYAEFYYQQNPGIWSGPYRQNGFFYEDFVRNQSDQDPENWTWEKVPGDYRFRVRFAPRKQGVWKCKIIANVAGYGQYTTSYFSFNVTSSDGHNFVSVGPNKRFLKIGSEPFFPVGMNFSMQQCYFSNANGILSDPYEEGCIGFTDAMIEDYAFDVNGGVTARPKVYTVFLNELDAFADAGANYFKIDLLPWFSDIEYEQICNYHNRMEIAWELDQIVKKAEQRGLFIHFNTQIQYAFEEIATYSMFFWDWTAVNDYDQNYLNTDECFNTDVDNGYCYGSDINLSNCRDFFSSTEAKRYYKKKLRYIIARYGYSTNIAAFETINESNGTCSKVAFQYDPADDKCHGLDNTLKRPYFASDGTQWDFRDNLYVWQTEMINYMKTCMGHDKHILSVNYLMDGRFPPDYTYSIQNLDMITQQQYTGFPGIYEGSRNIVEDIHNTYDKPFLHGEFGSGTPYGYGTCDNDASWIRDLWIGSFTGMCGSTLLWDNQHKRELWQHFGRLRSFVEGIDFDDSGDNQHKGWTNENDLRGDNLAEMMCLRNWEDNHKRAIGVVANRTYNYYTMATDSPCNYKVPDADYEFASIVNTFSPSWGNEMMRLQIPNMGIKVRYDIEWYNVMNGNLISTTSALRSSTSGKLDLPFPPLSGDASCPIVLFKIQKYKDRSAFVNMTNNNLNNADSLVIRSGEIAIDFSVINNPVIKVYPNPGNDKITVEISGANIKNGLLEVLNYTGIIVYSEELNSSKKEISIGFLENGIYLVRVRTGQSVFVTKFIKQ